MRNAAALHMGLALVRRPQSVGSLRALPLPDGITFLLEVAVGDAEALGEANRATGQAEDSLRAAAGFFIEQLLLSRTTDSYGCLGTRSGAPSSELRRNMSLLMKWLHPDVAAANALAANLDRSVFATRVTQAWDNLKTDERRAAYDAEQSRLARAQQSNYKKRRRFNQPAKPQAKSGIPSHAVTPAQTQTKKQDEPTLMPRRSVSSPQRTKHTPIGMFRLFDDGLLSRVMMFLRRRR
jgi:hypothetical protein